MVSRSKVLKFKAMVRAIPQYKRDRIKVQLELNQVPKDIAVASKVGTRTVQHYKKNLSVYGTLRPPKLVHQGRPSVITPEMEDVWFQSTFSTDQKFII